MFGRTGNRVVVGAPAPVALGHAGDVHARVVVEAEHVLQLHNGNVGVRREHVAGDASRELAGLLALDAEARLNPPEQGLVVVRAGVDDGARLRLVAAAHVVVGELHDVHARDARLRHERADGRGDR